jgi:hypothetical protein
MPAEDIFANRPPLAKTIGSQALRMRDVIADILRIPGPLDVIFRPWGFRGNEVRSQPTR